MPPYLTIYIYVTAPSGVREGGVYNEEKAAFSLLTFDSTSVLMDDGLRGAPAIVLLGIC